MSFILGLSSEIIQSVLDGFTIEQRIRFCHRNGFNDVSPEMIAQHGHVSLEFAEKYFDELISLVLRGKDILEILGWRTVLETVHSDREALNGKFFKGRVVFNLRRINGTWNILMTESRVRKLVLPDDRTQSLFATCSNFQLSERGFCTRIYEF